MTTQPLSALTMLLSRHTKRRELLTSKSPVQVPVQEWPTRPAMIDPMPRILVRPCIPSFALLLWCAAVPLVGPARGADEQVVREQHTVAIDGVRETWQLVWEGKPATVCGPDEVYMAITCPCSGWAYAEYGRLYLVRNRGGREIERMDLRPLFGKFDYPEADKVDGSAYLQRWPLKPSDVDRENDRDPNLIPEIKRRPATEIMKLADYDRDGAPTEFLIQVGTLPCGKLQFAAIGVTKTIPHLHALTSVAHRDTPLIMPQAAWQALLKSRGPTTVRTWACDDHGSETRSELVVSANHGAIRVKEREYSCPGKGKAEKLLEETDK